jgi:hypothetical protein
MDYRTRTTLLGLPLIHVATAQVVDGRYRRGIAKGWIAVGDVAFGVLLSVGGVAIGGVALGGIGIALISLSGLAVGLLLAMGGLGIGYLAVGGAAIAAKAAVGGLAVASEYALGGAAFAAHANDAAANQFLRNDLVMTLGRSVMEHSNWLLLLVAIPVAVALFQRKHTGQAPPR